MFLALLNPNKALKLNDITPVPLFYTTEKYKILLKMGKKSDFDQAEHEELI